MGSGVHAPLMVQVVRGTYELEQSRQPACVLREKRTDAGRLRSIVGIDPRPGSRLAGGVCRDRPEKRSKRQNKEFCSDIQSLYGGGSDGQDESKSESVRIDC